jgi:hypothetical protein
MKTASHYLGLVGLLISIALSSAVNAATLISTVDRNKISTNETLTLTVAIDQQVDSSLLNLTALQKDFEILSAVPQSRSSFNIINGRSEKSASTTWTITLVAKREGILSIPSFSINSDKSQPIRIRVSNATAGKTSERALDVKVKPSANEIYPNQQLIVEIELSARGNVRDLNGAQLTLPNADVQAFDQQNFQRVENGIARQIVTLKYSVFAKEAGVLTIPVMTYTGLENARRSIFGANGTQVIARSKKIDILVKEVPKDAKGAWFPAEDVSIKAAWSGDISALTVGEPITRTITVTARAQLASAIAPLEQATLTDGLKSYKDKPQLSTKKSAQGFVATRIESEAIVANEPGRYVIPSTSIRWWNTNTKKWQTVTLKEEILNVSGTAAVINTQAVSPQTEPTERLATPIIDRATAKFWQLTSALLSLIVLIQFYLLVRKPINKAKSPKSPAKSQSESAAWSSLQTTLSSNNGHEIRAALLNWGQVILNTQNPLSMEALTEAGILASSDEQNSKAVENAFKALDKHLFAGEDMPDRSIFMSAFKILRADLKKSNRPHTKPKTTLNKLYPE